MFRSNSVLLSSLHRDVLSVSQQRKVDACVIVLCKRATNTPGLTVTIPATFHISGLTSLSKSTVVLCYSSFPLETHVLVKQDCAEINTEEVLFPGHCLRHCTCSPNPMSSLRGLSKQADLPSLSVLPPAQGRPGISTSEKPQTTRKTRLPSQAPGTAWDATKQRAVRSSGAQRPDILKPLSLAYSKAQSLHLFPTGHTGCSIFLRDKSAFQRFSKPTTDMKTINSSRPGLSSLSYSVGSSASRPLHDKGGCA